MKSRFSSFLNRIINYYFSVVFVFECSIWSSAIILLVLAMIVVDLMVIFANSSFVFFLFWVTIYPCTL